MTIGRIPSVEGGIQPTIVDAKGDLIAATAADTVNRLAVGDNDQVLVADSSTSTGLAWKSYAAQFVAGKNKVINGDFGIWQRGTSVTLGFAIGFSADRFGWAGGTSSSTTLSQQSFTPGSAPVAGYESPYFLRVNRATTGSSSSFLYQKIEDVRTLAGQTVTVSFWAKAASNYTFAAGEMYLEQNFGSGGSASVTTNVNSGSQVIGTSWARYSFTVSVPSVSGKTIGTNSSLNLVWSFVTGQGTFTLDLWGVQLEAGSVATPFTTATGTLQGELAACQRYYQRFGNNPNIATSGYNRLTQFAPASSTTRVYVQSLLFVPMRANPSSIDYSGIKVYDGTNFVTLTSLAIDQAGAGNTSLTADVASGLTQYRPYCLIQENSTSHYLAFNAEL